MDSIDEKKQLRALLRRRRAEMPRERIETLSRSICENVISSERYRACGLILCFMSTEIEVDTSRILSAAFADGKRVAIPRCVRLDGEWRMEFRFIESPEDVVTGVYNLREPSSKNPLVAADEMSDALCIVPGLAYDGGGYRIGFGGGYYDRFLSDFRGVSCGVCFDEFTVERLGRESTDIAVDMLVTEKYVKVFQKK